MNYTDREVIGALLKGGGSTLFGARVELAWPDGLPEGMTGELLRSIGEDWAPKADRPQWVRADAEFCGVQVPCGKELLTDGGCERHGRTQVADPAKLVTVHDDDGSVCGAGSVFTGGEPQCSAHRRPVRMEHRRIG